MLQDHFNEPRADYALILKSEGTLTELKPDKLEFRFLLPGHLKDKQKGIKIEAVPRVQAISQNLQPPKGIHFSCNFCRADLK